MVKWWKDILTRRNSLVKALILNELFSRYEKLEKCWKNNIITRNSVASVGTISPVRWRFEFYFLFSIIMKKMAEI